MKLFEIFNLLRSIHPIQLRLKTPSFHFTIQVDSHLVVGQNFLLELIP